MIQTTSAAVTSTIDTNQILKIPTGSRSALEFVALLRARSASARRAVPADRATRR